MTLITKLGFVDGSLTGPLLSVTVFDDAKATINRVEALNAAIAASPASILGATLNINDIGVSEQSRDSIQFQIGYKQAQTTSLLISDGAQTKAKKLYNYIAAVGVYDSGGDITSANASLKTKPDRGGSIADHNSGKPISIDPLPGGLRLRFNTNQSFATDTYVDLVKDLVDRGAFNSAAFLNRTVASLQIVEFSIDQRDAYNWELEFGFGYRDTQLSVDVGDGISIPELRGCDHYWIKEHDVYEYGSIQPKATKVVVGQAWPLEDFSALNLPWQGTLTTRSTDTAGIVTTLYEHTQTTDDDATIFWEGGETTVNVTGVGTNTITFSSGSGDALPPEDTNVLIATIPTP